MSAPSPATAGAPSGAPPGPPAARRGARRWLPLVKLGLSAVLLVLVVRVVPWSDELVWTEGEVERAIPGEVIGDWKQDAIRFRVDPAWTPEESWPEPARARLEPGGEVAVERGAEGQLAAELRGSFDWRPGMPRVFRELDPRGLFLALALMACAVCSVITRWWRLLAVVGCGTTWWNALRLTFLGLFFNIVVPGLTGGDLIKAVLVVRENPRRRADALVSVVVDRVIGLLALAGLAAVVILVLGERFRAIRLPVFLFLAGGVLGALVYASARVRRLLRWEALLARLPLADKVRALDEALLLYMRRPREMVLAVLLSLVNHFLVIGAVFALGQAFGTVLSFADYLAVVPVANIVSSLPVAPGGWGVGEAAYGFLFELVGGSATVGVAVSVTFRLCLMALGLLGGLFLLLPGGRVDLRGIEGVGDAA